MRWWYDGGEKPFGRPRSLFALIFWVVYAGVIEMRVLGRHGVCGCTGMARISRSLRHAIGSLVYGIRALCVVLVRDWRIRDVDDRHPEVRIGRIGRGVHGRSAAKQTSLLTGTPHDVRLVLGLRLGPGLHWRL